MKRNHLICITQISAVTIVLAVVATGCTSAARYRCFQDEKALFAVMHKEIQNGDPYEEVSRLLGPGVPAQERMYIATKGLAEKCERVEGVELRATPPLGVFRRVRAERGDES